MSKVSQTQCSQCKKALSRSQISRRGKFCGIKCSQEWRSLHGNPNAGRPTKLSPIVNEKLIVAFQMGFTKKLACATSGISTDSFDSWMINNEQFRLNIMKAKSFIGRRSREVIVRAIDRGDTRAAMWWLERKEPQEFSSVRRVIVSQESPIAINAEVIYKPNLSSHVSSS